VFPVAPVPSGPARARGVTAVSVNDISAGSEFASASHYASRNSFSPINSPPGQIIIVVQFPSVNVRNPSVSVRCVRKVPLTMSALRRL